MFAKRTDLALEARELWQESAEKTTRLRGVKAARQRREGYPVNRVEILDDRGAEALGKPIGTYLTVDLTTFWQRRSDFFAWEAFCGRWPRRKARFWWWVLETPP